MTDSNLEHVSNESDSIEECMLTTTDNPYNPFTNFDEWYAYDEAKGYHSCSYLARIVRTSDDLSELDQMLATEEAIDEIVRINPLGMHRKVTRSSFKVEASEKNSPDN